MWFIVSLFLTARWVLGFQNVIRMDLYRRISRVAALLWCALLLPHAAAQYRLYIANLTSPPSTIPVVDIAKKALIADIALPNGRQGPEKLALSSDGTVVYTASDPIYVIDTATNKVIDTIPLPAEGLTPGSVGLFQVNLQIPALPPGSYPLRIAVGEAVSNSPTIAVSQ
jgi:YVTN family beta-propeller protein